MESNALVAAISLVAALLGAAGGGFLWILNHRLPATGEDSTHEGRTRVAATTEANPPETDPGGGDTLPVPINTIPRR
jgi:hypothetical protein